MISKLILRIILNAVAIYLANSLVHGFSFSGFFVMLFFIGGILAVFQSFIYPLLKIIAFPLVLLSFGLFGFIVNAAVLWGISYFFAELTIDGIIPLLLATIVLSAVNVLFAWL